MENILKFVWPLTIFIDSRFILIIFLVFIKFFILWAPFVSILHVLRRCCSCFCITVGNINVLGSIFIVVIFHTFLFAVRISSWGYNNYTLWYRVDIFLNEHQSLCPIFFWMFIRPRACLYLKRLNDFKRVNVSLSGLTNLNCTFLKSNNCFLLYWIRHNLYWDCVQQNLKPLFLNFYIKHCISTLVLRLWTN